MLVTSILATYTCTYIYIYVYKHIYAHMYMHACTRRRFDVQILLSESGAGETTAGAPE